MKAKDIQANALTAAAKTLESLPLPADIVPALREEIATALATAFLSGARFGVRTCPTFAREDFLAEVDHAAEFMGAAR